MRQQVDFLILSGGSVYMRSLEVLLTPERNHAEQLGSTQQQQLEHKTSRFQEFLVAFYVLPCKAYKIALVHRSLAKMVLGIQPCSC